MPEHLGLRVGPKNGQKCHYSHNLKWKLYWHRHCDCDCNSRDLALPAHYHTVPGITRMVLQMVSASDDYLYPLAYREPL
ncbi:hypothetical protein VTN00DRAFT_8607 [Thermoascus crustaceus]|uniref:uncharacterized protein n=1 Tax=Thermoascus crustaceus TaxID=5088 RepID=UPI003743CC6A